MHPNMKNSAMNERLLQAVGEMADDGEMADIVTAMDVVTEMDVGKLVTLPPDGGTGCGTSRCVSRC